MISDDSAWTLYTIIGIIVGIIALALVSFLHPDMSNLFGIDCNSSYLCGTIVTTILEIMTVSILLIVYFIYVRKKKRKSR
jgi:uncharacterized membrane protein